MRILVTGGNGQVGWELARALLPLGEVVVVGREQIDLLKLGDLRAGIRRIIPDVIVNAAAYTAVDKAEQETKLAYRINSEAPAVMAEELSKTKGLLIHYSTDYVFDGGLDRPYKESDTPNPVNIYGKSKLAGESAIQETEVDHLILRTSWVYSARTRNFMKTMLKLAAERDELRIVSDQLGAPTWSRLIAETTSHILKQSMKEKEQGIFASDIYNLTSADHTSWFGFAQAIIDLAKERNDLNIKNLSIKPIPTTEHPLPAPRPLNSRLDLFRLENKFELKMPHWEDALKYCMQEV